MAVLGYVLLLVSLLCNGSFLILLKVDGIRELQLHPMVTQLYVASGVFIMSILCIAMLPYNSYFVETTSQHTTAVHFELQGMVSGILTMVSICCAFMAADRLGIAIAQGIFGGIAIVTSYLWSTFLFREHPHNVSMSAFGIILLCVGIIGIACCNHVGKSFRNIWNHSRRQIFEETDWSASIDFTPPRYWRHDAANSFSPGGLDRSYHGLVQSDSTSMTTTRNSTSSCRWLDKPFLGGLLLAVVTGILGGSSLVPLHFLDPEDQGLAAVPSFGIGAVAIQPLLMILFYWMQPAPRAFPDFHFKKSSLYGLASGVIWNINNISLICAISILGYGVAFPISQCSIFIAGLWSILYLHEIYDGGIIVFNCAAVLLAIGATLLSMASN